MGGVQPPGEKEVERGVVMVWLLYWGLQPKPPRKGISVDLDEMNGSVWMGSECLGGSGVG